MEIEHTNDLFNFICGNKLGEGTFRTVYQCAADPDKVVKHDNQTGQSYSNINEFQIWNEYGDTNLGKWLAPVFHMSQFGMWLLQGKTTPVTMEQMPDKIPALFADTKLENWGMYEGRIVCHDYGNHRLFRLSKGGAKRLVKADWWSLK